MASSPLGGGGSPVISRRKGSPDRGGGGSARKSSGSKEFGSSILNSVNKSTSQFKKAMHRRSGSPINWFPRKKTDSYLKRKIKRLQEVDGMNLSLDETLGNANPHYTRMAREKIAAREAARKAMEARKAAMVEASWCRILQAARIQKKEAEAVLEEAKRCATEAFEAARTMGVMMYDRPDCPRQQCEVESSSGSGGRSTHRVTASFETAFEVDKEVAAAVKKAFIRLANFPSSSNKEEFKELLWKISQNPDTNETGVYCEAVPESEVEPQSGDGEHEKTKDWNTTEENYRSNLLPSDFNTIKMQQSTELVDTMLERLKGLHEDELASLAVIVATCGLNAALLETDRSKYHEIEPVNSLTAGSLRSNSRRYSSAASFMDLQGPKKEFVTELPSLDKFLVKHLSRLEIEVQEAREASKKDAQFEISAKSAGHGVRSQLSSSNAKIPECASDLGSILVKHVSKLEKEILEAKKNKRSNHPLDGCKDVEVNVKKDVQANNEQPELNNVASIVQSNCDLKGIYDSKGSGGESDHVQPCSTDCVQEDKENKDLNSHQLPPIGAKVHRASRRLTRVEAAKLEALKAFSSQDSNTQDVGLDKVLVKPVHRSEKEKMKVSEQGRANVQKDQRKHANDAMASESFDQILVKHVSRLERGKAELAEKGNMITVKKNDVQSKDGAGGLGDILVKRPTKLEQAKPAAAAEQSIDGFNPAEVRRRARERELLDAWGGLGLGNSMKPHVSKIERDKAAWRRAEEEEQQMHAIGEL